ncbi:hypothetical protein OJ997_27190 [Solirubrobacter phytolaccae]|uniref:Uncharacterized protein n=1 Tax=Solirubrobacter phytolaccae TaxID=1404360 RepID=A0A9X3SAS8_9ACTN|nr:hypothetical protein [Solirubrobacter phytolaccae]MDA0184023.1 hypothetical protein [Solirubrobacter phytolaccae]
MTLDWRVKRIAKNETSFRDINERLEAGLRQVRHTPERLEFICECGDRECESSVHVSFEEYEAVRADSRRFIVVPGHVFPETERVVSGNDRYEVVEKFGEAVEVTDASDRRSPGITGRRSDSTSP